MLVSRLSKKTKQLSPQGLSRVLGAFGVLEYKPRNSKLIKALELRAMSGIHKFYSHELINTVWGFASIGKGRREKLIDALERTTTRPLKKITNEEISKTLWTLAKLSTPHAQTFQKVAQEHFEHTLSSKVNRTWNAKDMSLALEALEYANYQPSKKTIIRCEKRLAGEGDRGLAKLTPYLQARILRALASIANGHRLQPQTFRRISEMAGKNVENLEVSEVLDTTWALQRLKPENGSFDGRIIRKTWEQLYEGQNDESLNPSHAVKALRTVAELKGDKAGVKLIRKWQELIKSSAMDSLRPPDIITTISSLRVLKQREDTGLISQLQHRFRTCIRNTSVSTAKTMLNLVKKGNSELGWKIDPNLITAVNTHTSVRVTVAKREQKSRIASAGAQARARNPEARARNPGTRTPTSRNLRNSNGRLSRHGREAKSKSDLWGGTSSGKLNPRDKMRA
ncbi:hypothetical protein AAMO2058_001656200 [Amorphochlora amoebiformis]|uniref:Uncharacterized protein n=1 Tax=Amorphochlora amoebiformis TaxID=1561963 RepID=A0A7S0DTD6_9EUKA|mmetsp:Transcript_8430/g.13192  ORF Transcript_8430/g.13192 Transcript_8430/m.13192 type:complete len:453 (+) Transcript_8430:642-2000(+)